MLISQFDASSPTLILTIFFVLVQVIALVGLPGRGKSFIARKLQNFLQWIGTDCKIYNVGKYRRQAEEGQKASANFFDAKNESAAALRQEVARLALEDMLKWIDEPFDAIANGEGQTGEVKGRVGIFDATNSTKERREWVLQQCTDDVERAGKPTGVVFIESVCDDVDLMRENLMTKISTSPDYDGMALEDAMADIMERCKKYEEAYETIDDDDDGKSYIKIFNLSSKIMVNHIYGMLAKSIVPALMAWNIGTRPIYLCHPAADLPGNGSEMLHMPKQTSKRQTLVLNKMEKLDGTGGDFKDALKKFMREECLDFAARRRDEIAKRTTKTPKSSTRRSVFNLGKLHETLSQYGLAQDVDDNEPFPCHIATSTILRACETAAWENMSSVALSNLNPLDKGQFTGMSNEDIAKQDSGWYENYTADPFNTRYVFNTYIMSIVRPSILFLLNRNVMIKISWR